MIGENKYIRQDMETLQQVVNGKPISATTYVFFEGSPVRNKYESTSRSLSLRQESLTLGPHSPQSKWPVAETTRRAAASATSANRRRMKRTKGRWTSAGEHYAGGHDTYYGFLAIGG